MTLLYFEDVELGDSFTAGPYLVAKSEIIQFAKQYDPQPRHIDEEAGQFSRRAFEISSRSASE